MDLVQMEGLCPDDKLIESGVIGENIKKFKSTDDRKNEQRP